MPDHPDVHKPDSMHPQLIMAVLARTVPGRRAEQVSGQKRLLFSLIYSLKIEEFTSASYTKSGAEANKGS